MKLNPNRLMGIPDHLQPGYTAPDDDDIFELEDDNSIETSIVPANNSSLLIDPEMDAAWISYDVPVSVKPASAVLTSLVNAGAVIPPYSATPDVVAQPMDRKFDDLASSYVFLNNSVVVSWDIPELGCQEITRSQCENMQLNSGEKVIHGSGQSALAVTGWRPKIDGVEAVQFVAHTAAGEKHAFLWYGETFRRVTAHSAALYECVGYGTVTESFNLLSGSPAEELNCHRHEWRSLDRQEMQNFVETEGIIICANTMEYRIKSQKTFNLHVTPFHSVDESGEEYTVHGVDPTALVSVAEVTWMTGRTCAFLRWRPDRARADTKDHILKVLRSVSLSEFLEYIPNSRKDDNKVTSLLVMSTRGPVHKHRVRQRETSRLAPYVWGNTEHIESNYLASVARELCAQKGQIDSDMLHRELREQGKYSSSGTLYNLYPHTPGPLRCILTDSMIFTPIPLSTTSRVIVHLVARCPRRLLDRMGACVHTVRDERFFIIYASLRKARYRWAIHGRYQYRAPPYK